MDTAALIVSILAILLAVGSVNRNERRYHRLERRTRELVKDIDEIDEDLDQVFRAWAEEPTDLFEEKDRLRGLKPGRN